MMNNHEGAKSAKVDRTKHPQIARKATIGIVCYRSFSVRRLFAGVFLATDIRASNFWIDHE